LRTTLLILTIGLLTVNGCQNSKNSNVDNEVTLDSLKSSEHLSDQDSVKDEDSFHRYDQPILDSDTTVLYRVDSIFVESFSIKGLTKTEIPSNFISSGEDDKFFTPGSLNFYEFKTLQSSDSIELKLVFSKPAYVAVFDGELKIVYLLTVGKNNKIIDCVRVGKTQSAAEWYFIETSIIGTDYIKRKSDESTLEEDNKGARRVHKLKTDVFKITSAGKIKRQPT